MKKIIFLSVFCAVSLCAAARPAQTDTVDLYVIDGQKIAGFDGSQLVGRSIKSYDVTTAVPESGKKKVYRMHNITTVPGLIYFNGPGMTGSRDLEELKGKISGIDLENLEKQLSGVLSDADFEKLENALRIAEKKLDIDRSGILKGVPLDIRMAKPLIIIDGSAVDSLPQSVSPEDISSVTVYDPGSKSASEYGDKGRNGVIEIRTRNAADASSVRPLFIVDGKEVPYEEFSALDVEQFKSITVYKNPEDTKKYTDNPGQGVIVVVTKGK